MISLSLITRLISLIIRELTHTISVASQTCYCHCIEGKGQPTLFPNQGVIAVIRVVGVTCHCAAAIAQNTEIELCRDRYMSTNFEQNWPGGLGGSTEKLVAEAAGMAGVVTQVKLLVVGSHR